jgi:hypothetical protein
MMGHLYLLDAHFGVHCPKQSTASLGFQTEAST